MVILRRSLSGIHFSPGLGSAFTKDLATLFSQFSTSLPHPSSPWTGGWAWQPLLGQPMRMWK